MKRHIQQRDSAIGIASVETIKKRGLNRLWFCNIDSYEDTKRSLVVGCQMTTGTV